jgi:hypothetical protein
MYENDPPVPIVDPNQAPPLIKEKTFSMDEFLQEEFLHYQYYGKPRPGFYL